jgi:hypothetical protein
MEDCCLTVREYNGSSQWVSRQEFSLIVVENIIVYVKFSDVLFS